PEVYIRKATQIGASEISLRVGLAVTAKFTGINVIYAMPSIGAAQKLAASRADPIIEASPRLLSMVNKNVDSTQMKQIGRSFIYFAGASATTSAISVPAKALLVDEVAFADPKVVSVFASRLGHNLPHERIVRFFSSPLHPHSDISAYFESGTQHLYLCYHTACGQWVELDPMVCLILPGFNDKISNLKPADLNDPRIKLQDAFVMCPHCRQAISQANLSNPQMRAWVPRYPEKSAHSYDANVMVLPHYRTPATIFNDLTIYKSTVRWMQFALGVPSESASDMLLEHMIQGAFTVRPPQSEVYYAVLGMDVGNTSHLMCGKQVNGVLEVFRTEKIKQDGENTLNVTASQRFRQYRAAAACVDASPDVSIVKALQSELPYEQVFGVFFVRGKGKS
ncbi:MAG: hypothetical protein EOM24_32635, partial [Chloroflexia bacterium]|nr:hypothetical protein [Chloroflexia bacterium]